MKLKKIVAAICAAAMTVSAVALTPLFASAETQALKTWQKDENGGAEGDKYSVSLAYGEAIDCKAIDIYLSDVTTNYIKMVVTKDAGYNGDDGWVSDYVNEYFEVPISGDTATLSIVLGETLNANGVANALTFKEEDVGKSDLLFAPNWLNAGSFSLSKIVIKNADGVEFKTIVGDEVEEKPEEPEEPEEPGVKVLFKGAMKSGNANPSKAIVAEYDTSAVINVTYLLAADEAAAGEPTEDGYYYAGSMAGQGKADGDYTWLQSQDEKDFFAFTADEFGTEKTFTISVADYIKQIGMDKLPNEIFVGVWNGCTLTKITIDGPLASEVGEGEEVEEVTPAPAPAKEVVNTTLLPVYNVVLTSIDNAKTIAKLKEGTSFEYELTDMQPVVKRRVFQSIMGKDITLKVTYKGMTWEYNGKDITTPRTINFKTLYEQAMAEAAE